jgi:hypothetical protein
LRLYFVAFELYPLTSDYNYSRQENNSRNTGELKNGTLVLMYLVKLLNYDPQTFRIICAINNGNCTEWSAIWCEIKRVITKSHDREAGVQFVITSLISHQNCTTRSAITTLLYSFEI